MHKPSSLLRSSGSRRALDLARVLVVHGDLAPRLALRTILQAGGYSVDIAGSPAEAISKLDANPYDLVLCDTSFDSSKEGGRNVLAYARIKEYRPATALVTSYDPTPNRRRIKGGHKFSVYTENLPGLLGEIAELIAMRACRRYRPLRTAV